MSWFTDMILSESQRADNAVRKTENFFARCSEFDLEPNDIELYYKAMLAVDLIQELQADLKLIRHNLKTVVSPFVES